MPRYDKSLDAFQGLFFRTAIQDAVGHIKELKISGTALRADISIQSPTRPSDRSTVVGVLNGFIWEGAAMDPIHLSFFVSGENRQKYQMSLEKQINILL